MSRALTLVRCAVQPFRGAPVRPARAARWHRPWSGERNTPAVPSTRPWTAPAGTRTGYGFVKRAGGRTSVGRLRAGTTPVWAGYSL